MNKNEKIWNFCNENFGEGGKKNQDISIREEG